ncbi:MAG: hypothetical protein U0M15_03935 [Bacillota bacterium]|nr:hypothetical protein [Bacillota bacterium]
MKRIFFCLILFFFFWGVPLNVTAAEEPTVKADAALVLDCDTLEVLWEKNGDAPMAPASLIKVLNIVTASPYLEMTDRVMVGPLAQTIYNGQMMGLEQGQVLEASELIYGMLLWSANDAAVAMADHMAGDIGFYATLMDTKAWSLGAVHTVSVNVNGYSDHKQKTTAYDMAVIGAAFLQDDTLAAMAATRSHELTWLYPEHRQNVTNINKFLFSYEGANGLKTGTTSIAGKCLMASAERNGRTLIAVALNSSARYEDCAAMMDYGFSL